MPDRGGRQPFGFFKKWSRTNILMV